MEKIKNPGFFKYILTIFIFAFCSFFSACDPDGFEVHFVIVGGTPGVPTHDGILRYAENCTTWDNSNNYTVNDSYLNAVTYYDDRFIAIGSMKGVYYSLDGITWTRGNTSGCGIFYDITGGESDSWTQPWVAYGNGKWVAVGGLSTILYSIDNGVNWQYASSPANMGNFGIADVVYDGSKFVAVGYNSSYEGVIIDSTDGINWNLANYFAPSQYYYSGIAFKPY